MGQVLRRFSICCLLFILGVNLCAQHSVARKWNDVLLEAIRNDFARPTVHARNLFHTSVAMYDAWAIYDPTAATYFLGQPISDSLCSFGQVAPVTDLKAAQEEAMSYAVYRLLTHRFLYSPGADESLQRFDSLMSALGYNTSIATTDYINGPPAAVGNHIAQCLIQFGLVDGSNEQNQYENLRYQPVNPPLILSNGDNLGLDDFNRWQPLTVPGVFIDQAGNSIPFNNTPDFLSPEWGDVVPFALTQNDLTTYQREDGEYLVYHDPGSPPYLITADGGGTTDQYKWGFNLVSVWSSQLDPSDGVMWDISPATIGNINQLPTSDAEQQQFYNLFEGGDASIGHSFNPVTGQPYPTQMVPRGDYTRVLAEFWADGPDSETPPGHWFVILNYVNDHPLLEKRFKGEGSIIDDLEWDVKAYFILAGAMHDAAISAWGIKGWYDYIRPVSAIRGMATYGQSSDPGQPNYRIVGINWIPGYIEQIKPGDPLAGALDERVGNTKLLAWRGPDFINDPETDVAGVGWIMAQNWWPYQRPSFVTPPFAGYISGHSTYSRAAAEVLTTLTGDPFFPGGVGEFIAPKNEFLVFEDGPSVDLTLQWATYRDASDQCSLSRIWGGIHPPADDIPGRLIGEQIGIKAFSKAEQYFEGLITSTSEVKDEISFKVYPNPGLTGTSLTVALPAIRGNGILRLQSATGRTIWERNLADGPARAIEVPVGNMVPGFYLLRLSSSSLQSVRKVLLK